jgi:hypothetical protein
MVDIKEVQKSVSSQSKTITVSPQTYYGVVFSLVSKGGGHFFAVFGSI